MITDYLQVGPVEVINHARLQAYLETVGSPLTDEAICSCHSLTAAALGHEEYTSPDDPDNPAEWYDPDVPESAEFAGFLLLSVEGADDHPVRRSVTTAVVGGGVLGPARVQPRSLVFTVVALGASCCGVDYGIRWLAQALQGCTGSQCGGDCVHMYACCPPDDLTPQEWTDRYLRTYRRVALTDGPRVTARVGDGDCRTGQCSVGADLVTVEFTLTAATPWAYSAQVPVLDVGLPTDDGSECVTWCVHDSTDPACQGGCRLAVCVDGQDECADPACVPPAPPTSAAPEGCHCNALAVNRSCYDLDLSYRPGWTDDVLMVTVVAGSEDLRRLTVSVYERTPDDEGLTCEEIADAKRCAPLVEWTVGYLPAGAELLLDGQTGRAVMDCGGQCSTATTVYGRDGAPPTWPVISCGSLCVCLSTDALATPAEDARVWVSVSGRAG